MVHKYQFWNLYECNPHTCYCYIAQVDIISFLKWGTPAFPFISCVTVFLIFPHCISFFAFRLPREVGRVTDKTGRLQMLAKKSYSSWWELLWYFSRCLLGIKFFSKTFFCVSWFSCTFGYVPVLLTFIREWHPHCLSIIKQPQGQYIWMIVEKGTYVEWYLYVRFRWCDGKSLWGTLSGILAMLTLEVPAFWDSLK